MSRLEETLAIHIRAAGLPEPEREYRFHPTRRWRADFAFPPQRLLVEVEGGIHSNGRHVRGSGFQADAAKYNAAVLLGWRILRFTARDIRSGTALSVIEQALEVMA